MDDLELKQTLERLEEQQRRILDQLAQSNTNSRRRDFWDKLTAISPILSGVAIALSALLCTYQYNQQQIKLQEAQTVEKFIPHLMGNDTSKRMAILAMKTLVNTDLAAKYAAMFPSEGTLSALKTIAKNGDSQDKRIVSKTYHEIEANNNGDAISKSDDLQPLDSTSSASAPPQQSEQAPAAPSAPVPGTANDTTASLDKAHGLLSKDHAIVPAKDHSSIPVKDHLTAPISPHSPLAEDKESLDDSQPKHEVETHQPQLERIRSSASKDETGSNL